MIKLLVSIQAAAAIIRFDVPMAGTYYLFSKTDGANTARVEACGHVSVPSHVAAQVSVAGPHKLFFARFDPDTRRP